MTPKPLARFWKSLDDVPNATTNRWEWSLRLKDDLPAVEGYLTSTGRRAKEIACPSPGGDGCARKIVKHSDGRFRAVCGNRPAECDSIELTAEEITCFALDRKKLAAAVALILKVTSQLSTQGHGTVTLLGSHAVAAGVGIPVVLMIPGPMAEVSLEMLPELGGPAAIVVPTADSISQQFKTALQSRGHSILALSEIGGLNDQHRLIALESAEKLLSPIREKVFGNQTPSAPRRVWNMPADARWEEMVFEFTAADALNIRFRGETRTFDAQQLDMKRKRTGKPTSQWTLLQSFAQNSGDISWSSPGANATVKKQKQLLSNKLIKAFGLADDPIDWLRRSNAYRTKFKISGTPLGFRHGQSARR